MSTVHERFFWAVEVLDIQPGDRVLELGCGAGLAADLVAQRLTTGHLTALDRSAAMIARAATRNRRAIGAGRLALIAGTIADSIPSDRYDKIFAFNVSLFWKAPHRELEVLRSRLADGGALFIFHHPPYNCTRPVAERTAECLRAGGYTVVRTLFNDAYTVPASCVVATPVER